MNVSGWTFPSRTFPLQQATPGSLLHIPCAPKTATSKAFRLREGSKTGRLSGFIAGGGRRDTQKFMRNAQELLTEKETELERVRKEIESLRAVIPLLADLEEPEPGHEPVPSVQATGTDGLFASAADSKPKFWSIGKRWRNK